MKKLLIFLSLVCDVALAKPYNCSAISFGEAPQKLLAVFDIEPNGGKPQEVVVSSPDTAKLWCYGQQTSDSIRLVCAIGDYSIQKVAPTASIRDGSDLLTLVAPVGKNNYAIACIGKWSKLSSIREAQLIASTALSPLRGK